MFNQSKWGFVLFLMLSQVAIAQENAPSDPNAPIFKKIGPPAAGTTKRITVQLTELPPRPEPLPDWRNSDPVPVPDSLQPAPDDGFAWYWREVSTSLLDAGPARVQKAIETLNKTPDGQFIAPRLQSVQDIADQYGVEILTSTLNTKVSPALALAIISVESSGRSGAVSSAGASGLMQLMPATAERFGVADTMDPRQNIKGGVTYMNWLMEEFGGDVVLALAGYNAGENAVKKNGGVPPYAETRAYVPKVLAAWQVAKGLCQTPPELITDPCVFVPGRRAQGS